MNKKQKQKPDIYGENYPIIWFQPEIDEALIKQLKKKKLVHFLSEYPKMVTLAKSLGISFLMMVPKDFDEALFLKNLKKGIYQRRLADFEEETIFKEFPFQYDTAESLNKFYLFYTREEFDSEILEESESELFVEKGWLKLGVKEVAKGFREELKFWERKSRGLEKEDAVFESSEEPQRFYASLFCKQFCIERLKELVRKRKQEKKKLIYFVNIGECEDQSSKYQKALESYTEAFNIIEKIYGEAHPLIASIYQSLAMIYREMENFEKAREYGLKTIELRNSLGPDFFHKLAEDFFKAENYRKAVACHQKALEIRLKIYGENHLDVASSYQSLATVYDSLKETEKVIECYLKIIDIKKSMYGEKSEKIMCNYEDLGSAYSDYGKYQIALEFYLKALEMRKLREEDEDLVYSYQNIGRTYKELKQYEKAVENYLKALEIQESLSEKSEETLASLNFEIGDLYRDLKEDPKALEYHQKSLEIRILSFGEEHIQTANSYNRLGLVSHQLRDFQKAIEFHNKALNLYISIFGELDSSVAIGYDNLAQTHFFIGEYANALECSLKVLHINTSLHGETHQQTCDSHHKVANSYSRMGKYDEALEHEMKALEIAKSIHGEYHEDVRKSHVQLNPSKVVDENFGKIMILAILRQCFFRAKIIKCSRFKYIYERLHQYDKGIEHLIKALDITKAIYGELHEEVISAHHQIYLACLRPQDYKKGLEHKLKMVEITKSLYGEISRETGSAYDNIAYALNISFRDREQSKKYLRKALVIFKFLSKKDPSDTGSSNAIENLNDRLSYYQKDFEAEGKIYDTNVM